MNVSRFFLETIVNYSNAASTDKTRQHLSVVALRCVTSDSVEISATDGHVAIKTVYNVQHDLEMERYYLFSLDTIKGIKSFLSGNKHGSDFTLEISGNLAKVTAPSQSSLEIKLLDRDYVRLDSLFDAAVTRKTEPVEAICFNPVLLEKLRKCVFPAAKSCERKGFDIKFGGKDAPILVRAEFLSQEHIALLMPIVGGAV